MPLPARIAPAQPPFEPEVQAWLDRTMPAGKPPLALFTTLARDTRLFVKFFSAGLLDRGHLTLRQREVVIHRTAALGSIVSPVCSRRRSWLSRGRNIRRWSPNVTGTEYSYRV